MQISIKYNTSLSPKELSLYEL